MKDEKTIPIFLIYIFFKVASGKIFLQLVVVVLTNWINITLIFMGQEGEYIIDLGQKALITFMCTYIKLYWCHNS